MEVSIEFQKQVIDALASLNHEESWLSSPFAIGLLTAATAIVTILLQKWQASKLQENQSEIEKALRLHALQIDALKALSNVAHTVSPRDEPSPGADSHEWLSPVVGQLSSVIGRLDKYLIDHGHVSPLEVCKHVDTAISIANKHKWNSLQADNFDYEPSNEEINGVLELISELESAVTEFKKKLSI